MGVWWVTTVSVVVVVAAAASAVSLVRNPPPTLDRGTRRRVIRQLDRGRLPADEPDRSSAVRLAGSRAASPWSVVMLVGLAVSQVLLARSVDDVDVQFLYVVAVLLLVAAGAVLRDVATSRQALRRLGAGPS